MPLYEFECEDCEHREEVLLGVNEVTDIQVCPECGEDMHRIFSMTKIGQGSPEMVQQPSASTPGWKVSRHNKMMAADSKDNEKKMKKAKAKLAQGKNPNADV